MTVDIHLSPTVGDVLESDLFQKARLVAGTEGLNRKIRWVHILQVSHIDSFVSGQEMILTTGAGLRPGTEVDFLQELINQDVSCLCIETSNYFKEIPELMIHIADQHKFPLIVFDETIRFIDLTQSIHSMIINRHHERLKKLEKISREFHRLTLSSQATMQILRLLYNDRQSNTAFLSSEENALFVPRIDVKEQERLKALVLKHTETHSPSIVDKPNKKWEENNRFYLLHSVGALGQTWGYLLMVIEGRQPEELDTLVLDNAAIAISQDLLRKRYLQERKLHTEHIWVDDLIHNRVNDQEQIWNLVSPHLKKGEIKAYRVCVLEIINRGKEEFSFVGDELETQYIHIMLLIRDIFKSFGFNPLMTANNNILVVVLVDSSNDSTEKSRILKALDSATSVTSDDSLQINGFRFGIGRIYDHLSDVGLSYQEALSVLKMNHTLQQKIDPFYEDLGIYRLLLQLDSSSGVTTFVEDTLGPLIEYDKAHGSELLPTLWILFEQGESKKIAAQKLHIVRQTMYYRLNKIKELLGYDFMEPDKKLSIEVALRALHILNKITSPNSDKQ